MRELADEERIRRFMRALGDAASREGECFLTGGTTAVLLGWRPTTLDVDIRLEPEQDAVLRALPGGGREAHLPGGTGRSHSVTSISTRRRSPSSSAVTPRTST